MYSFIQQLLNTYYSPASIFQALRIISLNNIDEVHDLKEFILQWRQTNKRQSSKFLLGQVLITAMKINKALRKIHAWEVFYIE